MAVIEPASLSFDAESHSYHLAGRRIDSVTQILEACGFIDDRWFKEEHADFGTLLHRMVSLDISGELDRSSLSIQVRPYLLAWKKFHHDSGLADGWRIQSEVRVTGPRGDYAGTADIIASKPAKRTRFLDIKSGGKAAWHRLQTAAYADCLSTNCERGCVYLRDDGTYSCDWHAGASDFDGWRAALAVNNWRRNNA